MSKIITTPEWVENLAAEVVKNYGARMPPITWREASRKSTSGNTSIKRISIIAGSDQQDQKIVLLHELAHWLTPGGHTEEFWTTAFDLYESYGLSGYATYRETFHTKGEVEAKERGLIKADIEIIPTGDLPGNVKPLTKAEAQALVDQVKQNIDLMISAVIELYQRRGWKPLGYESWGELCTAEFSALMRFRLPRPEFVQAVQQMTDGGMSLRAQGSALGVDPKTVSSARAEAGVENSTPQVVTGLDGKQYTPIPPTPAARPPRKIPSLYAKATVTIREQVELLERLGKGTPARRDVVRELGERLIKVADGGK
jgi:hypothetical protein